MKFKKNLIPVALLFSMLLAGFTRSVAQDVEVSISLPYINVYNNWVITFMNRDTGDWYTFETNDDTYPYGVLGTVPAGNYDIHFNSGYSISFEYGVTSPNFTGWRGGGNEYTWYRVVVEDGTMLHIED
jgi:hypothetical protein